MYCETDSQGYLKNFHDWNNEIACFLAKQENILLTEEHWEIIFFVRDFYQQFNTSPSIRLLTKALTKQYGESKGCSRYLYKLFPKGAAKQATRIAGLPKPVKCL